tara:strand:+ start:27 stop:722 length:696 start_codon:yes stop_codon:yes gene_type:complete
MKYFLAIDTSSSQARVGLKCDSEILECRSPQKRYASQEILCLISNVLEEAGISASHLDGIGVVTGPGSFTGVRIGVAAAQGLSVSSGAPLIGVSTMALETVAASSVMGDGFYMICYPAKSDEVYVGAYRCEAGKPRVLCEEFLLTLDGNDFLIPPIIKNKEWLGAGFGWAERIKIENALSLKLREEPIQNESTIEDLLDLCIYKFQDTDVVNSLSVLPNYIKEPNYSTANK